MRVYIVSGTRLRKRGKDKSLSNRVRADGGPQANKRPCVFHSSRRCTRLKTAKALRKTGELRVIEMDRREAERLGWRPCDQCTTFVDEFMSDGSPADILAQRMTDELAALRDPFGQLGALLGLKVEDK